MIIGAVVAKLGGGGDTDNGGGVPPSGESYYGRVKLFVYGTTNFEAWAKYNGKEIGPKDMEDIWKLVEVDIRVYDNGSADMPTVGEAKGYNALDDDYIVLTGKPKAIGFEITYGDLEPQPYLVERVAEDPNQLATNHERPVCIDLSE